MENVISEWLRCPVCGNKTRLKIRGDTKLKYFPLFCPKCRQETLINVKHLNTTVIKEPDAEPITRRSKCGYRLFYIFSDKYKYRYVDKLFLTLWGNSKAKKSRQGSR